MSFLSNCSFLEIITVIGNFYAIMLFENDKLLDPYWDSVLRNQGTHFTPLGFFFSLFKSIFIKQATGFPIVKVSFRITFDFLFVARFIETTL